MHLNFDGPQLLSNVIRVPCLKSVPVSLVWALVTHQISTNSGRGHHKLCAYAWWLHTYTLKVILIKLPAGCLSCEYSFPPPTYKFCPQPSWLTFNAVLMEEETFRVFMFFISRDISIEIWSEITTVRWFYSNGILARNPKESFYQKPKNCSRILFKWHISVCITRNTTICHEKLKFLDGWKIVWQQLSK